MPYIYLFRCLDFTNLDEFRVRPCVNQKNYVKPKKDQL